MKYSDVVLVTSRAEGFGVVFLEAFNAKTPVVAFDVPAANELIVNQESGALAKPYDVHDLAKQIITLLQNEQTGKMYAARSYTRLKNDFALKNMVDETIQWYKTVMNS